MTSPTPTFQIPTIDISPYLASLPPSSTTTPPSPHLQPLISAIRTACLTTGFFQITGHGIPRPLQHRIFSAAARFFDLPFEEKEKLDAKKSVGHRGYDVLGTQSYEKGVRADLKEGFYVGAPLPTTHPLVAQRRFFMGPNIYPPSSLIPPSELQHPAEEYHAALLALSRALMRLIAQTLPYGPGIFEDFIAPDPAAPLRLLHYPSMPETKPTDNGSESGGEGKSEKQFGASPHTDFGAITILLQDGTPGLQVQHPEQPGTWVAVPPREDALVVNVGDMLSMWTGGEYRSSVHRVVSVPGGRERYSVVFFLDGRLDCELGDLRGGKSGKKGGKVVTVEEHMLERMAASYGKGKKMRGEDAAVV